jgi:outer membrane protein assembly factor BamB
MVRTFLAAATCLLIVAASSEAAKVKVWQQNTPAHYDKAQLKGAVVSSEGTLRLSRQLKPLTGLDASHVWDVIEDKDGALIAATGDEGRVYKVAADGKATILYKSDDSQVLCLAAGGDGSVYAGTGPSGQIVRIDPRGQAKVFCETGEGYVWSLAVDPKTQALYAGTGPKGRILRVTPEGKASVFYSTKQDHVLCLATAADGTLYAGTDRGGLVYKIDAKGKGFVLYQAVQGEIRCLRVTDNAVYAGTSSPTKRRGGAASASSGGGTATAALDLKEKEADAVDAKHSLSTKDAEKDGEKAADAKESSKGSTAPSAPAAGENSVYRIGFDGGVREVFREKSLILSILRDGNRLLIGTGMDGQLFEVDEATKERSELARLDHGQILSVLKKRDGSIVLAAGDPGKLYVMSDKYADKGTITSEVFDAKLVSKWGSLRWQAETPDGTSVRVAVRSGNVAEPDETWSDWSAEQTDGQQATIAAPAARFLQYRVTLVTTKPTETPALRSVALRYMTTNQAPEVSKLEVPDLNAVNLDNPKKLKIKWTATDANEDELTYSLYVKKDGWKNWVLLDDDLEKTEFEWDTTTTPSGTYQVKVVASDRKDNSEEEALTGERVSVPFVVCHTPPTVTVKTSGIAEDQVVIEAKASSPLARITSASFAVNGKKWANVFPEDGLFDSKEETFKFKTEGLKPGTYVLVLRVRDAAGNTGSGDVVFTVQPKK